MSLILALRTDFTTIVVFTTLKGLSSYAKCWFKLLVHWPIFSTAANGGMFFSSHVTGQSHNPARGSRLGLDYNKIIRRKSTSTPRYHKAFILSKTGYLISKGIYSNTRQ